MSKNAAFVLLAGILIAGCGQSVSYEGGRQMADQTYAAISPQQMLAQVESIQARILGKVEGAKDKKQWWNGFCDRGEEIWLERIDQVNSSMGQEILSAAQIRSMFRQMRANFRE